jgi:hypothetical protein
MFCHAMRTRRRRDFAGNREGNPLVGFPRSERANEKAA